MSEPAWKRLGLKVKAVVSHDPLAIATTRLNTAEKPKKNDKQDSADSKIVSTKEESKPKEKSKKRKADESGESNEKSKKPPKRAKVPKSERKESNVVKDQFMYIKQFASDRDNWKFSKQKQNWIIKNIRIVPEDYESYLITYLQSVQGASKDRIASDMKAVVEDWNKMVESAEQQMKKDLEDAEKKKIEEANEDEESGEKKSILKKKKSEEEDKPALTKKEKKKLRKEKQEEEAKKVVVDYDFAVRARSVYRALTEKDLTLAGVEDEEEEEQKVEEVKETKEPKEEKKSKKSKKTKEPKEPKEAKTVVEVSEESVYL